ncbi:MAG TPA: beta-N-acetylglucosaminidase domain-containing protein [Acidimicrobiales bacterium]|nr:beta-N-acetylglucosaminidase domain-containing protein [Acidimicrobiales bacterium]
MLEGFYGRPWSWDERVEVMRWCAERGMTHYVYAPKDDPKQRSEWREPYTEAELDQFRRLATEGGGLTLGCSVSPGLSIDYRSGEDRALLMAKIESVVSAGAGMIQLQFDDIPHRPELGVEHADITSWVHTHLAGRAELVMCPVEYVGWDRTPYLDALADGLHEDVSIAWTGRYVVNETITVADAEARAAVLGGRKPSLWDNYPVNDGMMSDQLFIGPLRGRDPGLLDALDGIMFNALVQPHAGLLPLASCAAFLRGEDPVAAWRDEAARLGWLTFAEACDGAEPRRLVGELVATGGGPGWSAAATALAAWLRAAAKATAPGLDDEVAEFLGAVRDEASFCLKALRLYQDTKPVASIGADGRGVVVPPSEDDAMRHGMAVVHEWKRVRRSEQQVLGPRLSTKVAMRTASTGGFSLSDEVVLEDLSATDALVRAALDQASELAWPAFELTVNGTPVGDGGRFVVPVGSDPVVVQCGAAATRVEVPGEPPLPERRLSS